MYLFKYVTKGPNRSTVVITEGNGEDQAISQLANENDDEIQTFLNCRYVSACEALWRINEFDIHYRRPLVKRLSYHLERQQNVLFNDKDSLTTISQSETNQGTMFTEYRNEQNK